MTTRTSRARRAPRGRTARMVWVNTNVNFTGIIDGLQNLDLLAGAAEFMVFDTTIVQVVIPELNFAFTNNALTTGNRQARAALQVGPTTMDSVDFQDLYSSSIGAPWMWFSGAGGRIPNTQTTLNLNLAHDENGVRVKAQRRFRENDSTLWLVVQNRTEAGDTGLQYDGFVRTLLRIP